MTMHDQEALEHLHQHLDISRDDAEQAMWYLSAIMPTHDVDEHIDIELGRRLIQGKGYFPTIHITARDGRVGAAADVLMPKHVRPITPQTDAEGLDRPSAWISRYALPDGAAPDYVPTQHHKAQEVIHAVMHAVRIQQERAQEQLALNQRRSRL